MVISRFLIMKHVDKAGGGDTTTGCSHGKSLQICHVLMVGINTMWSHLVFTVSSRSLYLGLVNRNKLTIWLVVSKLLTCIYN